MRELGFHYLSLIFTANIYIYVVPFENKNGITNINAFQTFLVSLIVNQTIHG